MRLEDDGVFSTSSLQATGGRNRFILGGVEHFLFENPLISIKY